MWSFFVMIFVMFFNAIKSRPRSHVTRLKDDPVKKTKWIIKQQRKQVDRACADDSFWDGRVKDYVSIQWGIARELDESIWIYNTTSETWKWSAISKKDGENLTNPKNG